MKGKCKLCENDRDLKLSHVIPASIYRWLKQTSGTVVLRGAKNSEYKTKSPLNKLSGLYLL